MSNSILDIFTHHAMKDTWEIRKLKRRLPDPCILKENKSPAGDQSAAYNPPVDYFAASKGPPIEFSRVQRQKLVLVNPAAKWQTKLYLLECSGSKPGLHLKQNQFNFRVVLDMRQLTWIPFSHTRKMKLQPFVTTMPQESGHLFLNGWCLNAGTAMSTATDRVTSSVRGTNHEIRCCFCLREV